MFRETKNIDELRSYIIDWANSTDDEKQLKKTAKAIEKAEIELSSEEEKSLLKALKEADNPDNLVSHEKAVAIIRKRISEKSSK